MTQGHFKRRVGLPSILFLQSFLVNEECVCYQSQFGKCAFTSYLSRNQSCLGSYLRVWSPFGVHLAPVALTELYMCIKQTIQSLCGPTNTAYSQHGRCWESKSSLTGQSQGNSSPLCFLALLYYFSERRGGR